MQKCAQCAQEFEARAVRVAQGSGQFCSRACFHAHRTANKQDEKGRRKFWLKKCRYGIEEHDYLALLAKQNSRCAICNTDLMVVGEHVDHCHTTGKIRGILCRQCNVAIGMFKNDPFLVQKAIDYLLVKSP